MRRPISYPKTLGVKMSITTIDCNYVFPEIAASFLMKEGENSIFIETNTSKSIPYLLKELENQSLKKENVKYIIITHVHLDHAGGTSELLKHCPNATVLAHPKAAPHIISPERLVKSSQQVYGEEKFLELYGKIEPVPSDRVKTINDGDTLEFGNRKLTFLHTRGHANHHFVIFDSGTNSIFTGDSFGMGYKNLQLGSKPFLFPSTTPTDYNYEEAIKSIDRIIHTNAERAYLTHFGEWNFMKEGALQLKDMLSKIEEFRLKLSNSDIEDDDLQNHLSNYLKSILSEEIHSRGLGEKELEFLRFDIDINAMGLAFSIKRERKKKQSNPSSIQ